MDRRALVRLICCGALVLPVAAYAQSAAPAQAPAPPASTSQSVPETQPAAGTPSASAAAPELSRSLFEPTWRQFMIGGRLSSVAGDPARWQRYDDVRDGLLFTDARYAAEGAEENSLFRAAIDHLGWRNQRLSGNFERTGRFVLSGTWDQIPQFYSVDTATPYAAVGSGLVLDDATQRAIQSAQANLNAYVPIAPKFELRERRDVGRVSLLATPTPQIDVKASFNTIRHVGELPWGASFGFGNDVEVALPYDSRTNDFTVGAEWTNTRNMIRVAYEGSWFDNLDEELVWDSPLRVDDHPSSGPGRGRMTLWPSNSAQTVSAAGYTKLARRTQLTGFVSFGSRSNDEPLQPFTVNAALPQLTLPRSTTQADAQVFSTNLNLVSRPTADWRFSARLRQYGYDNQMPHTDIPQFINYDTSIKTSSTGGPELYAHSRTSFDADATWSGLLPLAINVGYARNNTSHDFRIFENTGENVFHVTADAIGSQWVTFRAEYQFADRTGSGLNEALLTEIGEQPDMRHYDVANRTRNRFTGQVDVMPNDEWTFNASTGVGTDDFDDSYFGLHESTFRVFALAVDYRRPNGFGGGISYNYERYAGDQQSRSASPGQNPPQETDPLRNWTVDATERVNYFSIYAMPPRIGRRTEARVSYDYSYAKGSYLYAIPAGSPLTPPNQLPDVFNKLQQLHVDVRHRLSNRMVASLSYMYEPFRVYDFAFDQTVVNSIVQPSSLVLGYIYRPYTAHSASFGVRYYW